MDPDWDMPEIVLPMWIFIENDYGIEVEPLRPLSFDRVNESKAPVSESLLFRVPLEITGQILECLPQSSLASLALVCRDFRQLARSRQFASINLDYSDNSLTLIKKLVAEVSIRAGSYGNSNNISQSLGVCIRRITVAEYPAWIDNALSDEVLLLGKRTRAKRRAIASKHSFDCYLQEIRLLLSSKTALPHLEWLDWQDNLTLPRSFFQRLPFTSLQHLRLVLDEKVEIELLKTSERWPLRTLFLEVNRSPTSGLEMDGPNTHPICPSILRLCASTLESLTWQAFHVEEQFSFATYKMDLMPHFPRLRRLSLRFLALPAFSDYSVLDALLEGNLREMEIGLAQDSLCSEFFEKRGTIPTLKTLVWWGNIESDQSLTFLRENSQLSKLSLQSQAPGTFLVGQLLPLLTKSFRHLISLSLLWGDDSIPVAVLDAINSLETLQQLHLSAGNQPLWDRSWLIDHALMRIQLKNLTSLRRMAFTRDTYNNESFLHASDMYYEEIHNDPRLKTTHRKRMLSEAAEYAVCFPEIESLYFGQLCIGVSREDESQGSRPKVFALSEERDDWRACLREIFGWKAT